MYTVLAFVFVFCFNKEIHNEVQRLEKLKFHSWTFKDYSSFSIKNHDLKKKKKKNHGLSQAVLVYLL